MGKQGLRQVGSSVSRAPTVLDKCSIRFHVWSSLIQGIWFPRRQQTIQPLISYAGGTGCGV